MEQITRVALARELNIPLIASQPQYSMLWRVIETDVIPTCQREGLGQVVWSPLAQGILTRKYQPGKPIPNQSRANSDAGKPFFQKLVQRWMQVRDNSRLSRNSIPSRKKLILPYLNSQLLGCYKIQLFPLQLLAHQIRSK